MRSKKNQRNNGSPNEKARGFTRPHSSFTSKQKDRQTEREGRNLFSPPFLTEYLQQQIQEQQTTIDFLEEHFGEASSKELCQKPAQHIVVLEAILACLDEFRELKKVTSSKSNRTGLKLNSLKSGQGPANTLNPKSESQ